MMASPPDKKLSANYRTDIRAHSSQQHHNVPNLVQLDEKLDTELEEQLTALREELARDARAYRLADARVRSALDAHIAHTMPVHTSEATVLRRRCHATASRARRAGSLRSRFVSDLERQGVLRLALALDDVSADLAVVLSAISAHFCFAVEKRAAYYERELDTSSTLNDLCEHERPCRQLRMDKVVMVCPFYRRQLALEPGHVHCRTHLLMETPHVFGRHVRVTLSSNVINSKLTNATCRAYVGVYCRAHVAMHCIALLAKAARSRVTQISHNRQEQQQPWRWLALQQEGELQCSADRVSQHDNMCIANFE
eukprot:IDg11438t1